MSDRPSLVALTSSAFLAHFVVTTAVATAVAPQAIAAEKPTAPREALDVRKDEEEEDAFPPSPIELTEPDPLLPWTTFEEQRPLTPAERERLARELDALNDRALAQYQAGNVAAAFELWNRELRLRRFVSAASELDALARVGEIAWEEDNLMQVQAIGQRLRVIERELFYPQVEEDDLDELDEYDPVAVDAATLAKLGRAYEFVGAPDEAADIYEGVLALYREQNNRPASEETLQILARLNVQRLNYETAAQYYEELAELALARGDRASAAIYLEELALAYDQLGDPAGALTAKQPLLEYHQSLGNGSKVIELQISMGRDYQALGQLNDALNSYQAAYSLAWSLQELHKAAEALGYIARLYESQNRQEAALQVYRAQIEVHQWARNNYGMMVAYDRIGRIYRAAGQYRQAREAFQNGLVLAADLGDRAAYFTVQIEQLNRALAQ